MEFLNNILEISDEKRITGLTLELKSLYTYQKFKQTKENVILVTSNLHQASKYYTSIANHTNKVWFFPMDDFLTSEAISISPEFKVSRLETINNLVSGKKGIIVTNLMGYLRFLPSLETFKKSYIKIKINDKYDIEKLVSSLLSIGYKRQPVINMTGEIAVRGFILDIFPINFDNPIRIEFFDSEIENIKIFDVDSQRTKSEIEDITVYPNTEFLIEKDSFEIPYRDIYKYMKVYNISSLCENRVVIYDDYNTIKQNYELLIEEMYDYNISKNRNTSTKYMFNLEEIKEKNEIFFENFDTIKKQKNYNSKEINVFPKKKNDINHTFSSYLKKDKYVVVCLDNRYQVNTLIENLENENALYTNENNLFKNKINIIVYKLNSGFETETHIVITKKELYGKEITNDYKSKFKLGTKIKDINKLEIGDYVVHTSHGIGRYLGIKTVPKSGIKKDYLMIEYKDKDKLYIPVEKLELINKYSSKDGIVPKLNKLGSSEWIKTKARAQKRAENMAEELLELYALRESQRGFAFSKDTEEQLIFESEFQYTETSDQLRVTEEIKKDMESIKPMDRLLCGDVGYGKTEVAFRAIFKCIMSGKQAAILCPTTILSSQHFKNAKERFSSFPVNIALLNRFIPTKKITQTKEELINGKIDLLIGTHRILSDDIEYKNLGLLIVDEEQRFGVRQKEKIKKYKNNIDVLTLSATPIPRTLQMSMSGLRGLSLIETPPAQRYPIQTYVLNQNSVIIKDAIYKEMARGGQTFILYNRVENISSRKYELEKLVPDAKIAIAHGQMDKNSLESVMQDFSDQKYDVLLCTTIIETGIDIPSVNTLIIIDADKFGLSQLYQIRGRIGRSNKIAYCYLMYDSRKILSEIATKRLSTIKEFTELGSGFSIAMRDLSIRGAGDILGKDQAGYIDAVGIELFMDMLNEQINKMKGKEEIKEDKPNALIDVETFISDDYVEDESLKIEIHQKINEINSYKKLKEVKQELEDRFGKISEELEIYMYEELFESVANKLNITDIKQTKNFVSIILDEKQVERFNIDDIFYETSKLGRMFRFSSKNNNTIITLDTVKLDKHFIYYLIDLLKILEKNMRK